MSLIQDLAGISSTKKSIAVVALGVVIAAAGRLAGGGVAAAVVGCGLIGLGLVLLIVAQAIQFMVYRQSQRFGKGLQRDVSEKFRAGWQRLAKAGKDRDPYFLPWYIMVGEPGAGKTQAIKHSHIKFVPGFNDPATGEGGTLAMDWWFADKAILLDTAGALLMDTARTEEFQEFLHRIRQHRPKLPINGLILAIPANALQTDTTQEIQAKAAVIAQQLDLVQRELGVRFPVYVIITKADLISGFRDFFDNISDPTVPNQILGWSNPGALDGAFDPGEVEAHLQTVAAAMRRRRMGLLLDPAGTDPAASRIDKTDALFAFPEQLAQTGLRLRTYLENVFTPSEWTQAPLFLRGIYFTSSMREGPPLDLDLARAFNISPKDLPAEVRVWEREKACFLRDLFVEKIFREKGLVTASTEVDRRVRRRHQMVLGIGAAAVVAVIGFTLFGYIQLKQSVGEHYDFWSAVTRYDPAHPESASLDWLGEPPDTTLASLGIHYDDASTLADIYAVNDRLAQEDLKTPWIFVFAQEMGGDVNALRSAAHRLLFERGVSRAAWGWLLQQRPWGDAMAWPWDSQIPAAQRRLAAGQWSAADAAGGRVLAQLILMDSGTVSHEDADSPPPQEVQRLKDLLRSAGWPDDGSTVRTFRNSWLWFATHGDIRSKIDATSAKWAHACVDWMIAYYNDSFTQAMQRRQAVLTDIQDYDQKEQAFLDMAKTANDAGDIQRTWGTPQLKDLLDAGAALSASLQALADAPGQGGSGQVFGRLYDGGGATAGIDAMSELIDAIGPSGAAADLVQELTASRDALRQRLANEAAGPRQQVRQLSGWSQNQLDDWENWPYATRWNAYRAAAKAWDGTAAAAKAQDLSAALASAASLANLAEFGPADRDGAYAICHKALQAAAAASAGAAWDAALNSDQAMLTQQSAAGGPPVSLPPIPFATLIHQPPAMFSARTARIIFARMQDRQKLWANPPIVPANQSALAAKLQENQMLLSQYEKAYAAAWSRALDMRVLLPPDFSPTDIEGATEQLKQLGNQVADALSILPPDPEASAALESIHAGLSAPGDLEGLVKRLLGDWTAVQLNIDAAKDDTHWRDELQFLNTPSSNYVSAYWTGIAREVSVSFELLEKNPSVEVSLPDPQDAAAPPDAAASLNTLRGLFSYIQMGTGAPVAIAANARQSIKFCDGLDVRLLGSNNASDIKDTAGGASDKEVLSLLMDAKSVQSAADPNVFYVKMVSQQGNTLWLKLKLGADAPRMPVQN